jgi:hypothetical protein
VRYELNLDVASLTAIDTHVHVEVDDHGHSALTDDLVEAATAQKELGGQGAVIAEQKKN